MLLDFNLKLYPKTPLTYISKLFYIFCYNQFIIILRKKMSVIIQSTIKTNPLGRWYIELKDTTEEDHMVICLDINEYALKIEEIGVEYGGEIDVAWQADDEVTQEQINEVRMEINAYEEEREQEKAAEAVGGQSQTHQDDGTPIF